MNKKFCIENQKVGDIILVSNKAISSHIQRVGQTVFSLKKSNYSHAILALEKGIYIEAMKGKHIKNNIDIICIDELQKRFQTEYKDNWKIVRLKKINSSIQEKIVQEAQYFYGQLYNSNPLNKRVFGKHYTNASFCSELVQRIYEKSNIQIGKKNQDIWPLDLDLLTKKSKGKWHDVTSQYKRRCPSSHDDSLYVNLCLIKKSFSGKILLAQKAQISMIDKINDFSNLFESIVNDIDNKEGLNKELYNEFFIEPTFYNLYLKPIINMYEIEEYNKVNKNIEINSFIGEAVEIRSFTVNSSQYEELLLETLKASNGILKHILNYFNMLMQHNINTDFKSKLQTLVNSYNTYENKELLECQKIMWDIKENYPVEQIDNYYYRINMIINNMRRIHVIKKSKILYWEEGDTEDFNKVLDEYNDIK